MVQVIIIETGKRTKNSKEFGYKVCNDVSRYRHLDYENRAKRMQGQYLLEEKNWPDVALIPFRHINIVKRQEKADQILYNKAKQAAKKALEALVPQLIDETQMSKKSNKETQ